MSIRSHVLLAICVFLFLTPGDARLCIKCIVMIPGVPCKHKTCEVDDEGICIGIITYKNEKFIDKILDCAKKDKVRCENSLQRNNMLQELRCCDDTDFCNASF
ncbi:---NA--- [Podarcis lilfordi]|uniref:---NA n=1 Tax=Podarcis lilfordi TaxID=74358 RepID=A0AA35K550_9SAUR|nr:---NA--- [Podarcis lilfordi]